MLVLLWWKCTFHRFQGAVSERSQFHAKSRRGPRPALAANEIELRASLSSTLRLDCRGLEALHFLSRQFVENLKNYDTSEGSVSQHVSQTTKEHQFRPVIFRCYLGMDFFVNQYFKLQTRELFFRYREYLLVVLQQTSLEPSHQWTLNAFPLYPFPKILRWPNCQ